MLNFPAIMPILLRGKVNIISCFGHNDLGIFYLCTMKVLLDANILFPPTLRDLLLFLAKEGVFTPFWSDAILEEWQYNVMKQLALPQKKIVQQLCADMQLDFPHATISDYGHLIDNIRSRDKDDRHVVAAAIHSQVNFILTFNVRDFTKSSLRPYGIVPIHPDKWLCLIWDEYKDNIYSSMEEMIKLARYKDASVVTIIDALYHRGLIKSMRLAKSTFTP